MNTESLLIFGEPTRTNMPKTKYGEHYHHCNRSGSDHCDMCKRQRMMYWRDAEEKNGWGETFRWTNGQAVNGEVCEDCYKKLNSGRPPLSLQDLQQMRKTGESRDQYYKRHGY